MLVQRPLASRKKTSGPRTETGTQIVSCWGIVNKVKDCVNRKPRDRQRDGEGEIDVDRAEPLSGLALELFVAGGAAVVHREGRLEEQAVAATGAPQSGPPQENIQDFKQQWSTPSMTTILADLRHGNGVWRVLRVDHRHQCGVRELGPWRQNVGVCVGHVDLHYSRLRNRSSVVTLTRLSPGRARDVIIHECAGFPAV